MKVEDINMEIFYQLVDDRVEKSTIEDITIEKGIRTDWGMMSHKNKYFITYLAKSTTPREISKYVYYMPLNVYKSKLRESNITSISKDMLKNLLSKCTEAQQLQFKKMYCHKNLELSIDDAVEQMDKSKIDWAITQAENTINK